MGPPCEPIGERSERERSESFSISVFAPYDRTPAVLVTPLRCVPQRGPLADAVIQLYQLSAPTLFIRSSSSLTILPDRYPSCHGRPRFSIDSSPPRSTTVSVGSTVFYLLGQPMSPCLIPQLPHVSYD
jgi:hypothetical protein